MTLKTKFRYDNKISREQGRQVSTRSLGARSAALNLENNHLQPSSPGFNHLQPSSPGINLDNNHLQPSSPGISLENNQHFNPDINLVGIENNPSSLADNPLPNPDDSLTSKMESQPPQPENNPANLEKEEGKVCCDDVF